MSDQVVITRKGTDIGVNDDQRVYITGPHFGTSQRDGVFSSTPDRAEAARFSVEEAEALLAFGKWRATDPQIEVDG